MAYTQKSLTCALLLFLAVGVAFATTPEIPSSEMSSSSSSSRHLSSTSELDAATAQELAELIGMLQNAATKKPSMHRNLLADSATHSLDLQGIINLLQNVGNLIKPSNSSSQSPPQLNLSGLLTLLQNLGINLPTLPAASGSGGSNGLSLEGVMNFLQTIGSLLPSANSSGSTTATDLPSAFVNVLKSLGSLVTAVATASNSGKTPELSPLLDFLQCVGQLFVQLAQNVNKA